MAHQTAIYDACVLYPASIRSFLMWIGFHELVHTRWTERTLDECFSNLVNNRPDLDKEDLSETRRRMCEAIPNCLVTGYEQHIENLQLPDPDDRHVLAAAIEADADTIVTFNLSDFPASALAPHDITANHPDVFVSDLFDDAPAAILQCLQDEASIRDDPPRSQQDVLDSLEQRGLEQSARRMRNQL